MEESQKPKNSKTVIQIVGGILVFAVTYFAVQQFLFKESSFDEQLTKTTEKLNKKCPMIINQETRLDNSVAIPGNTIQYNYTLVNYIKDSINVPVLEKAMEPSIISDVKTNPDLKIFREHKTTFIYYYKDKQGVFITKISATPDKYSK